MISTLSSHAAASGGALEVQSRGLDRHVRAADASHFLVVPESVVIPREADAVSRLMRTASDAGLHMTFRGGGTGLSGQGVTDGLLVNVLLDSESLSAVDGGARVRVQPGLTLRQANGGLAPLGRRLGPDPASEEACTVGGSSPKTPVGWPAAQWRTAIAPSSRWSWYCPREQYSTLCRRTRTAICVPLSQLCTRG